VGLNASDLVGAAEIGQRLGVDRRTVHLWRQRHADFPQPVAELKQALVWSWPDVAAWAKETGRL
jgi:predicted DNA-binding transcriptional regulator AlpA